MCNIRKFNSRGIEEFQKYLAGLREDSAFLPPHELLTYPNFTEEMDGASRLEPVIFQNKLHMVEFLSRVLRGMDTSVSKENKGFWGWLSLYFFDQVCPESIEGERKPGKDYRHIPEQGYRFRHRHLLAGPFHTFKMHGHTARLLLDGPVDQESQIHHQLATRQGFITNFGVIEAADELYFDRANDRPKRGVLSTIKPGSLFRFIDVVQQLDLTYDLYSLEGRDIISLLPEEFDSWKAQ
ncbi:MAG: hypothetical protein COV67_13910 [Nitrospinae bacterium CG11_big_fil_rev_8_21_14_0_20_56_8]|nr:MAG: hypothetical protein COV67_13910 [Nitrospinae bacterium CG11_big_fil_rev_8_21_14_0_20_56_8]